MKYSANYNMKKPELNEQYRLEHWNDNTDIIDAELKRNADNIETAETILQNAINDESSRATNAETALRNITDLTFKTALLNFCYPIGSLYWSSSPTNPAELFGGTWTQIKDRFILTAGDTYANGATGGSATVKLTVSNLPAHSHSFSWSGTTSETNTNHTHKMSHTHTRGSMNIKGFTGDLDRWRNALNNQNALNALGISTNAFYSSNIMLNSDAKSGDAGNVMAEMFDASRSWSGSTSEPSNSNTGACNGENYSIIHSHTYSGSGTTGNGNGTATAFSVLNPYVVKYCWERTA